MKTNIKIGLGFVAGAIVGGFVTHKIHMHVFENMIEDELESVRQYVDRQKEKYADIRGDYKEPKAPWEEQYEREIEIYDEDVVEPIQYQQVDPTERVDYHKPDLDDLIYEKGYSTDELEDAYDAISEEFDGPEDDEPEIDRGEENMIDVSPIRMISDEEFNETMNHYDKISIVYYAGDGTLADERDEIIPDIEQTIGLNALETLEAFGAMGVESDIIHVRNDNIAVDFEVVRDDNSYSEVVLGVTVPEGAYRG